jgi:hypothetical protein
MTWDLCRIPLKLAVFKNTLLKFMNFSILAFLSAEPSALNLLKHN